MHDIKLPDAPLPQWVISSAMSICANPRFDGYPCCDCRYTMSVLGVNLIHALVGQPEEPAHRRWCDEIRGAALDA